MKIFPFVFAFVWIGCSGGDNLMERIGSACCPNPNQNMVYAVEFHKDGSSRVLYCKVGEPPDKKVFIWPAPGFVGKVFRFPASDGWLTGGGNEYRWEYITDVGKCANGMQFTTFSFTTRVSIRSPNDFEAVD